MRTHTHTHTRTHTRARTRTRTHTHKHTHTQVKCYLQMSAVMESAELQDALDVIESTNLKYFTKEMISEFMALKGSFLAQIGRYRQTLSLVPRRMCKGN